MAGGALRTRGLALALLATSLANGAWRQAGKLDRVLGAGVAGGGPATATAPPPAGAPPCAPTLVEFRQRVVHGDAGDREEAEHPEDTFAQRVYVEDSLVEPDDDNGTAAPRSVFVYVGFEGELGAAFVCGGFIRDLAREHRARVVGVEHRWFGDSLPFDTRTAGNLLRSLSVSDALADLEAVLSDERVVPSGAKAVLVGGSYAGVLASDYRKRNGLWMKCSWAGYFRACSAGRPCGSDADHFYGSLCKGAFAPAGLPYPPDVTEDHARFGGRRTDAPNVLYANGDLDGWSALGVAAPNVPTQAVALLANGSHCTDMRGAVTEPQVPGLARVHAAQAEAARRWLGAPRVGRSSSGGGHSYV